MLKGVCRAKLVEEVVNDAVGYRQFILQPTDIPEDDMTVLQDERVELSNLLNDARIAKLEGVDHLRCLLGTEIPTSVLVDVTAATICDNSDERYQLLALNDATARAHWLIRRLKQIQKRLLIDGDGYARLN